MNYNQINLLNVHNSYLYMFYDIMFNTVLIKLQHYFKVSLKTKIHIWIYFQ